MLLPESEKPKKKSDVVTASGDRQEPITTRSEKRNVSVRRVATGKNLPPPEVRIEKPKQNIGKPKKQNIVKPKKQNIGKPKKQNIVKPKKQNIGKPKKQNIVKPKSRIS